MSFQLIHTSYPHLLDSSASGYGTVARSENMPRALITKLSALSIMREPKGGCCTRGPQFSYRIIDMGGAVWHVLSCIQTAGADYSGRACHTAHHLVLSQQEVAGLLKSSLRPTPAGITLALQRSGFWVQKWQGEPRYIEGEPPVQHDSLPDASMQPTWKHLTGHKSNARAFYTPPYNRECLITLPADTLSSEVLGLFHESDWLTHSLGWGVTYTTEADDADSFADTLRMVTAEHSPLVQRAVRTGHPVLHITRDMELPMEPAAKPVDEEETSSAESASSAARKGEFRVLSRTVSHYHYTEEPDWMQYDVPMPGSNPYVFPLATVGSFLLLTGITVGIWLKITRPTELLDWIAAPGTYIEEPVEVQMTGVQKLENLIRAPYNHEKVVKTLSELGSMQESAPEDALLIECATLISQSAQEGMEHPAALRRIAECARLLGLKEEALATLYLREATREQELEIWHQQETLHNMEDWVALRQDAPLLFISFTSTPELQAYEPGTYEVLPTPTTELATADKTTEVTQAEEQEEKVLQVIGTQPAVRGGTIPAALANVLDKLPLTITSGYYCVSELQKGDKIRPVQRIPLSPGGFNLTIVPSEKEGEYLLSPSHKAGQQVNTPPVIIRMNKNKVHEIKSGHNEAIVSFPVPVDEQTLTNIILAPKIAIPLPAEKAINLPPGNELDFRISPDNLVVTEPKKSNDAYTLEIRNRGKAFPWKLSKAHANRIEFEVQLPVLIKENRLLRQKKGTTSLKWKETRVIKEDADLTKLRCVVEHRPNLPDRLVIVFDRIANAPCLGLPDSNDKALNLAHLYYIGKKLKEEKPRGREALFHDYLKMLAHPQFGRELRLIMQTSPHLLIDQQNVKKECTARLELKKEIVRSDAYKFIIKHTCATLRNSLEAAYNEEIRDFEIERKKKHCLILQALSQGEGGELLWHFHLQTEK